MLQLKSEFIGRAEVKKFSFKRLSMKEKVAYLYEVTPLDADRKRSYYEVFRHTENKHLNRVAYPGSNSFGSWAWTFPTLERAQQKYKELCNSN